jgi:hypothetical protein
MSEQRIVVMPQPRGVEPASERIRRLQAEARNLAREHINELKAALIHVSRLAEEVSAGGDLYPVGPREFARRLAEEAGRQALALTAILERH